MFFLVVYSICSIMKKLVLLLYFCVLIFFFSSEVSAQVNKSQNFILSPEVRSTTNEMRDKMNLLWQQNSFWTRNLILCIIDSLPGKDQAIWRLTKNHEEICELFNTYFGEEAKATLTELFYSSMNFELEVINASLTDSILAKDALKKWHQSIVSIAEQLYRYNSKWMLKELKGVLSKQIDLTYQTICQRLARDYDLEVMAFDTLMMNTGKVSNMLSQGLIYQYPQKFSDLLPRTAIK